MAHHSPFDVGVDHHNNANELLMIHDPNNDGSDGFLHIPPPSTSGTFDYDPSFDATNVVPTIGVAGGGNSGIGVGSVPPFGDLSGLLGNESGVVSLDEMDHSSAAAAAASLDAFLADQSSPSPSLSINTLPSSAYPMIPPHVGRLPGSVGGVGGDRGVIGSSMSSPTSSSSPSQSLFHHSAMYPTAPGTYPGTYPGVTQSLRAPPAADIGYVATASAPNMAYYPPSGGIQQQQHHQHHHHNNIAPYPGTVGTMISSPPAPVATTIAPAAVSPIPSPLKIDSTLSSTAPVSPASPSSGSHSDGGSDEGNTTRKTPVRKNVKKEKESSTNKKPITEEEIQESKRQQRLMRNRASAQLSRERKKAYMKKLEGQLKELQQQNANLASQLAVLRSENESLRARSATLPIYPGTAHGGGSSPGYSPHSDDSSYAPSSPESPEMTAYSAPSHVNGNGRGVKRARTVSSGISRGVISAHQQWMAMPPMARTAGVVMFALCMSFAVFYSMTGIGMDPNGVKTEFDTSSTNTPTVMYHQSRILQADGVPRIALAPSSETGAAETTLPTLYALVKKEHEMTPVTSMNTEEDTPVVVVKQESGIDDAKAVEVYQQDLYDDDTSEDTTHTHNHAHVPAPSMPSDYELFQQWKKMIVDSNLTLDTGSSYMFCPSAIQMRPQPPVKTKYPSEEKESAVSARLRRAGLPLPNSTHDSEVAAEAAARLSPSNNRVRFWVPTSSVLAGGDWDTSTFTHDHTTTKHSGFTEIECAVSGIRPVMVVNTATTTA